MIRRAVLAVAIVALPLAAWAAQKQSVDITVILPMSGPGAFIGQTDQKVLTVLEALVNKDGGIRGRPLRLTYLDDQSNPQNTVALAAQVIASRPNVVLGPGIAALCSAAQPAFNDAKVFDWCYSPTFYPPVNGYVYASLAGSQDLMRVFARYMRDRNIKRLAMLSTTDVTGKTGEKEMVEVLKSPENSRVSLVADEFFAPTDVSVAAQLSKIKAASPDALLIWTAGTPLGTALTGIRDASMQELPIFSSSASMVWSQIVGLEAVLPKELYFVGFGYNAMRSKSSIGQRKLREFRDAVIAAGMHVDGITGLPWDATMITVDALRALGPDATSEQIRAWVASQRSYVGISGIYNFHDDMHGIGANDLLIVRWIDHKRDWEAASDFGGAALAVRNR